MIVLCCSPSGVKDLGNHEWLNHKKKNSQALYESQYLWSICPQKIKPEYLQASRSYYEFIGNKETEEHSKSHHRNAQESKECGKLYQTYDQVSPT